MKFALTSIIIFLVVSLAILVILYFICNYTNYNITNNYKAGLYVRVYGDINQPKYMERYGSIIKYYDDNKNITHSGIKTCSFLSNKCIYKHDIKKSISIFDLNLCRGTGFAEEKHGRYNVKYESFHKYYDIEKLQYYNNTYHFNNGDISSAVYKKISNHQKLSKHTY